MTDITSLFQHVVEKNHGRGGAVFRVGNQNAALLELVSGAVDADGNSMTPTALFEVASITKTFTATSILLEMEAGKLSLDDPASRYVASSVTQGLLVIRGHDFGSEITLRQLLAHTSGLPDNWTDPPLDSNRDNVFTRTFNADVNHLWTGAEIMSYVGQLTPIHTPGGSWHYADSNYVLLGLVLEAIEGKALQDIFHSLILDRLGLHDTYLSYHEATPAGALLSHRWEENLDLYGRTNQSADWASGGLVSSTRDLEKFCFALAGGKVFANATTLTEMQSWIPTDKDGVNYGLGLYQVILDGDIGTVWGHDGDGNSFMYIWPDQGILFTGTLNQTNNDWWPLVAAETGDT